MSEELHYAIIKCACGDEPSDAVSDQEAADWIVLHVQMHDGNLPAVPSEPKDG